MTTATKEIKGTKGIYKFLTMLAKGGMAEIWLARQNDLHGEENFVVVKKILPRFADQQKYIEMFLDEARITARFDHHNVVRAIELGKIKGSYFMIMEYLEGESLAYLASTALKKGHRLPQELAAGIIAQVCDGLEHAHKLRDQNGKPMNVIHRDVSRQNIIVLFSGRVKLVDFGIAAASERIHETRTGVTKGKLSYMSPEQCLGKTIDPRTDIFSLGIVLWEVLAGRRLFKHKVDLHTLKAIVSGDLPSIRQFRPEVSTELESIAMRALKHEPKDRFASIERMGEALKLYIKNSGARVGEFHLGQFYLKAMPERIKTKQQLLEELASREVQPEDMVALKPDTDASMPSDSSSEGSRLDQAAEAEKMPPKLPDPQPDELQRPSTNPFSPAEFSGRAEEAIVTKEISLEAVKDLLSEQPAKEEEPVLPKLPDYPPVKQPAAEEKERDADSIETVHSKPSPKLPDHPAAEQSPVEEGDSDESPKETAPSIRISRRGVSKSGWNPKLLIGIVASVIIVLIVVIANWPSDEQTGDLTGPVEIPGDSRPDEPSDPNPADTPKPVEPEDKVPDNPKPPDKKPVVEEPAMATLAIGSEPAGCKVRLNGKLLLSQTPLANLSVKSGTEHLVAVFCPKHKMEIQRVSPVPGEKLKLDFKPTKLVAPKLSGNGFLRLNTDPWCEVYLGKRKLGITPLLGIKLPKGDHRLRLVNKDLGIDKNISVRIRPGKTTSLLKKLE
ncbi:MAG: protein kinase [Deltaproteobacteria bacterium]|nr:protein kinase [Deltaproteobacteria bacterium]